MSDPIQKVAFVTCADFANLSDDDRLAADVLEKRGIKVDPALWDSDAVDWKSYDMIVMRSTWDYYRRYEGFLSWLSTIENMALPLWNPVNIVRWNSEKTYLRDLAKMGAPMAPTMIVERGASRSLEGLVKDHAWPKAVVKPTVGAASYEAWITDPQMAANDQEAFDALLKKSSVMVQLFMPEIVQTGEWSFIFFNRQYSHTVLKQPRPGDFRVQRQYGGTTTGQQPAQAMIDQATAILNLIDGPLLYARVDGIDVNGRLLLMELELIEPRLFMDTDPQSATRFADAIVSMGK